MALEIKRLRAGDEAVLDCVAENVFDDVVNSRRLSTYLAEPNQYLIVALEDSEVVGQIRAIVCKHPDKADELFIENLGVTSMAATARYCYQIAQCNAEAWSRIRLQRGLGSY